MFSRLKKPIFKALFISPHFDDAVLSSCLPLIEFAQNRQPVLVVTIFTRGQDVQLSADARSFLHTSQATTAQKLFQARAREDKNALKTLGPTVQALHLEMTDGLFRVTTEGKLCYPNFKSLFSGHRPTDDDVTLQTVVQKLEEIKKLHTNRQTQIYAPAGIGSHADHLITHTATQLVFKKVEWWADSPYHFEPLATMQREVAVPLQSRRTQLLTPTQATIKQKAVQAYRSQLTGLYQTGLNQATLLSEHWYETT